MHGTFIHITMCLWEMPIDGSNTYKECLWCQEIAPIKYDGFWGELLPAARRRSVI